MASSIGASTDRRVRRPGEPSATAARPPALARRGRAVGSAGCGGGVVREATDGQRRSRDFLRVGGRAYGPSQRCRRPIRNALRRCIMEPAPRQVQSEVPRSLDPARPTRRGRRHYPSGVFLSPHRGYRQATPLLVINDVLTPGAIGRRPRARTAAGNGRPAGTTDRPDAPLRRPRSARAPAPGATTETRKTTCYMCACRCGIRVHLRDGEVRYIDGNPDHPLNKGVICAKGSSGIMKQYSPARLTQAAACASPAAERGAGEFVEITLGRGVLAAGGAPAQDPRDRSEAVRAVHRPRPDAGADRPVRAAVRHAELRGARRLLLGQHGRRHDLHDRRLVLGVRRPGPRAREAVRDDRHRRGPSLEPAQDRDLEVQARRRALHLDQPDAHRLLGDRRRVGADPARAPTARCCSR